MSSTQAAASDTTSAGQHADGKLGLLECTCGKVQLAFTNDEYRAHLECCCVDCHDWLKWAHGKGGLPAPPTLDCVYFENDFTVTRGKDNLKFFKMAPKYPCIRAFSTCCWSQMAVQHPAYGGNVVCCGVSQVKSSRGGPVQMQFNTADLTLENADLVEQVGQWRYASFPIQKCKSFTELVTNENEAYSWLFGAFAVENGSHEASTFNDVMAECGGYETLNMDRSGKKAPLDNFLVEDTAST